jgi:Mg2+/Co2+ transporter CorB
MNIIMAIGHSRIPVYSEKPNHIIGLVLVQSCPPNLDHLWLSKAKIAFYLVNGILFFVNKRGFYWLFQYLKGDSQGGGN